MHWFISNSLRLGLRRFQDIKNQKYDKLNKELFSMTNTMQFWIAVEQSGSKQPVPLKEKLICSSVKDVYYYLFTHAVLCFELSPCMDHGPLGVAMWGLLSGDCVRCRSINSTWTTCWANSSKRTNTKRFSSKQFWNFQQNQLKPIKVQNLNGLQVVRFACELNHS